MEHPFANDQAPAFANALILHYGSERNVEAALGIKRSTLNDWSIGRTRPSAARMAGISQAIPQSLNVAIENIAGLLRARGGPGARNQKAAAVELKAQNRQDPGSLRDQANRYAARLRSQGLDPFGRQIFLPNEDIRGRFITPEQERAYRALARLYADHALNEEQYTLWLAYQLGGGSGGYDVPIADL